MDTKVSRIKERMTDARWVRMDYRQEQNKCPGKGFDWPDFHSMVVANGMNHCWYCGKREYWSDEEREAYVSRYNKFHANIAGDKYYDR